MTDATVANVALVLRVCILGGALLALPRIGRKGLLFGAYVGEDQAETVSARNLRRVWDRGCLAAMGLGLAVGFGISLAGWPVTGNLTGTVVLLLAALGLYASVYSKARQLAPPGPPAGRRLAVASLDTTGANGTSLARFALAVCVVTSLGTVAYAAAGYARMPSRVPSLLGTIGSPGLFDKSLAAVLFTPLLNLTISSWFAVLGLLMAGAKRSIRSGWGGRSKEAQDAFRATNANVFSVASLLICGLLSLLSVQMVRVGRSEVDSVGVGVAWAAGALLLFLIVSIIRIMRMHGQGGALREDGSAAAPLTGSLTDNRHWVLGLFYVDKDDPSMMVEKRFGIGYTLNWGNRNALLLLTMLLSMTLGLVVIAVTALR